MREWIEVESEGVVWANNGGNLIEFDLVFTIECADDDEDGVTVIEGIEVSSKERDLERRLRIECDE